MKITLVISDLTCGGSQRVLTLLANYWDEQGHNVTLVTLDDGLNIFYRGIYISWIQFENLPCPILKRSIILIVYKM